jgi:cobalt-zinc-cadmium efflux system outer membrane protein
MRTPIFAAVLSTLIAAGSAGAQPAAPPAASDPVLDAILTEALARNPDILAARQAVEAARARVPQEAALPESGFSAVYTNDSWRPTLGTRDMTTLAFMASQAFPFPGKQRLRASIAELEARGAEQRLERLGLTTVEAVRRSYARLILARSLLLLVRDREALWKEIEGVARARYAVGQGAQQDVVRVQIEVTRIEQLLAEQELEAITRQAEIDRLMGRDPRSLVDSREKLTLEPETREAEQLFAWTERISPELAAAGLEVERQRRSVELARRNFSPDFGVQAGYMNRASLDPMWVAGVSLSFPVDRRRVRGALAESQARLAEAEQRVEALRQDLRQRTQTRLARLKNAERIASLYENGIIPQDQMSVESAVASYQAGKVPFLAVLEATGTLYADRENLLRTLADHESTKAALEAASLDSEGSMPGAPSAAPVPAMTTGAVSAAPMAMK